MKDQFTGVPRAVVPDRVAALRVKVVMGLVFLAAACGPLALLVTVAKSAATPTVGINPAKYAGFAQIAAQDFLAGRQTGLALAEGVPKTLGRLPAENADMPQRIVADGLAWQRQRITTVASQRIETHTFMFQSLGRLYQLDVPVMVTDQGPVLAAIPTLSSPAVAASVDPPDYSKIADPITSNPSVVSQITAWGDAFAAGDEEAIYRLTGDSSSNRYPGLGGYTLAQDPTIRLAIAKGSTVVAQVRLWLVSVLDPNVVLATDFDLLLENFGKKQLPDVAAWGPTGSGPTLERYQNAVSFEASNDTTPITAPPTTTTKPELYVPPADTAASDEGQAGQ